MDYGKELNERIASAKEKINRLTEEMYRAESTYEDLLREKDENRKECEKCNDCSMCLG